MTRFAMVFPGQGSQAVGMLAELGRAFPVVRETFEEASEALGLDLWRLAQEGPEEELNRTERTQPALLAAGVAVWRAWRDQGGPAPAAMAGHSLGEYTALVCAGALGLAEGVRLVAARGRYMQEAVPEGRGAMAALLGLADEAVEALCREASAGGELVVPANYNAPGQVVVAGHAPAVARVAAAARAAGAKRVVPLAVSAPSHSPLMAPAAARLAGELAGVAWRPPEVPVVHNVDAQPHPEPDALRRALARQLTEPVRWTACVRRLAAEGAEAVVECGPGKVLCGLVRRIQRGLAAHPAGEPAALAAALEALA
ncbi:MAG: [acyl-carrier-protein] S-malonyltransferase [Gammaproteobacteria bacterium]|nr:MAG: [acyl-carrier-protein] S-malonyltransferase [Gammaproteobacteria bacterium]